MDIDTGDLTLPDWPALTMAELESLLPAPDCPCCVEAPPEPARWAIPGVFGHVEPPPRPPASRHIAAVTTAIAGLAGPGQGDDLQALVDTEALMQAVVDLRVSLLPYLADAHARRLHVAAGQPTLSTWRARRFPDVPAADLTLAGRLRRLPALEAAVQTGQVGLDAARRAAAALLTLAPHLDHADGLIDGQPGEAVIAAVVNNTVELIAGSRAGVPDDDPLLSELVRRTAAINEGGGTQLHRLDQAFTLLAARVHADALPSTLGQQRDALLPDELERRAQSQSDRRSVRLEPRLDDLPGDIHITPDHELYELFWTVLHAAATHDPQNQQDTAERAAHPLDHQDPDRADPLLRDLHDALNDAENDDREAGLKSPRSKAQRLHDALKLVLQQFLAAGLAGSTDKAPVAITVTIPSHLLEQRPGALPGLGRSGTTLPRSLLKRWWCDARVTAYVLSKGLIPLGLVHQGRTLTATERVAANLQRGGLCDRFGCCRAGDPLLTLTPHHVFAFSEYGRTCLAETIMACDALHDDLHHGKTVQLRDGRWVNEHGWVDEPLPLPWH